MTPPLKILHIGNGTAFKIKAIVDAFLERGHEIHMIPLPAVEEKWAGVTWHQLPKLRVPSWAATAARFLQLRRLAQRLRPDVVHAHNAWGPGWYGAFAGIHPLVIHAYGGDLLPQQYMAKPAMERRLTSWACRTADRVIVTGQHMIDASAGLDFPRDRLMLLPRGIDVARYRPGLDTRALRDSLGVGEASPVILSPRYQVDETLYNLDVVIDAFAAVRQQFPNAVCLQMFDPRREAGRARLARAAAERGLGASYRLVPIVDNATMPLFYNLADAVASVPSTDGFPVTVLEASACGAALVVSRLPYCREWFTDGENGLLVPEGDAGALTSALVTLCRDPELRRRIGAAGRQPVVERADYGRCMDALELEYWNLVAKVNPGRAQPSSALSARNDRRRTPTALTHSADL
jgi:glycosyltransferase involved in cell wall biosynthesis